MLYRKLAIIILLSVIALLSACSGASTSEKIYDHLEEAVTLEEAFEKQQDDIVKLEKKEQELYSQIIDLSMDEFDKIKSISQEAISVIEKRKEKIKLEKESIDASKEEFKKIEGLIEDLEEKKAKDRATKMYDVMMDRFDAYDKLNDAYTESLKLEKELYKMLQEEDLKQETLTEHIKKINDSYKKVLEANENFNTFTEKYNQLKKEFYESANIEVNYEKEKKEK
ncbi:YkyA family protein [Virgibacillus necropolis]|uniref:YkyA family protein n=1 Tax=Virgibacillus necropolis TaxID=163877 RepID=UPI001D040A77|nr:YkyA family protein [Virgibacillus necropolis]